MNIAKMSTILQYHREGNGKKDIIRKNEQLIVANPSLENNTV